MQHTLSWKLIVVELVKKCYSFCGRESIFTSILGEHLKQYFEQENEENILLILSLQQTSKQAGWNWLETNTRTDNFNYIIQRM
jgi:hypothetical protein